MKVSEKCRKQYSNGLLNEKAKNELLMNELFEQK
tara:strand:+ start:65 stop:166 length:102 start_codon:yes stop_codon:yes gene_type:complete